jgi:4,4'-diaponeurosporenoate glycosyltransferase
VVGVQLAPEFPDLALYVVGWTLGWLLLWRGRPLPSAATHEARRPCAVVVPARNEAAALPALIDALRGQLRDGDELVVVDDHSDDDTGAVANGHGARVANAPALPSGWLGKPHACSVGAAATSAPTLLFIDADVVPAGDLLDRIDAALTLRPTSVVSVQPWHSTGGLSEQAGLLFNVTSLMGCGAFTVFGDRIRTRVAFGPVLALRRTDYERIGGHADPAIRTEHTEDIAIARAIGRSHLFTGAPDTTFRMYPDGLRATVDGWTRTIATGARSAPWWLLIATIVWIWSLAGGWLATPIVYPFSAVQLWILGRRAGSMHPATAVFYPVAVLIFVLVFVRSLLVVVFHRPIRWKGRVLPGD